MPLISQHQSLHTTRLIIAAHSGAGKTGSLASLAAAGYNLRILDFDNGCDVLRDLVLSDNPKFKPLYKDRGAAERISFETLTESYKLVGGKAVPSTAKGWERMTRLLENWKSGDQDFGPVTTWGPQDVLVIDSSTGCAKAAYYHICAMNGKLLSQPEGYEWQRAIGAAQALFENLMDMLTSEALKCNVILMAHINYQDEPGTARTDQNETVPQQGFINVIGRASGPRVPRRFNSMIQIKKLGASRRLVTETLDKIDLKTAAPSKVKRDYSLETGLAEFFADLRGGASPAAQLERKAS